MLAQYCFITGAVKSLESKGAMLKGSCTLAGKVVKSTKHQKQTS